VTDRDLIAADLLRELIAAGILAETPPGDALTADLVDRGLIDSLGLIGIQGVIAERWSVEIPAEVIVAECRSIAALARHIADRRSRSTAHAGG